MNRDPLVSVIIPSFNHAKWVGNAIESVLNQTYENVELIVVDDQSTDDSRNVISNYASAPRVRAIFKNQNRGQGHSCNLGLNLASGTYVAFLPSDDWYLPDKIKLQVKKFENVPLNVGLIYGRGLRFYEDTGEYLEVPSLMLRGDALIHLLTNGNFIFPASPMFRKSVFDSIRFDEEFSAEGEAIYTKIAGQYQFDYVDEIVAVMRAHSYNSGNSLIPSHCEEHLRWWKKYFSDPATPPHVTRFSAQVMGRIRRMHGLSVITELGELERARRYLVESLRLYPLNIIDHKILAGLALTLLPRNLVLRLLKFKKKREKSFSTFEEFLPKDESS